MATRTAKIDPTKIDRKKLAEVMAARQYGLVPVSKIVPNPWNKNKMGAQYYAALKANIANPAVACTIPVLIRPNPEFFVSTAMVPEMNGEEPVLDAEGEPRYKPMEIRGKNPAYQPDTFMIVDGEHRWRAMRDLDMELIPAIRFAEMSDALSQYIMVETNAIHGATADQDIKEILARVEKEIKDIDVWASTVIDEPVSDAAKYGLRDDEIDEAADEKVHPVNLFFTGDQISIWRRITGQIRLTDGCTQEVAIERVLQHFEETTGMGGATGDAALDTKQADLLAQKGTGADKPKRTRKTMTADSMLAEASSPAS